MSCFPIEMKITSIDGVFRLLEYYTNNNVVLFEWDVWISESKYESIENFVFYGDLEISRDSDAWRKESSNFRYEMRNKSITYVNRHIL